MNGYAVKNDGQGWRAVDSETDIFEWETFSVNQPDPYVLPIETLERSWRDAVIESVKWVRERHRDEIDIGGKTTITGDMFSELLTFIQELRDWPKSSEFPLEAGRPKPPAWLCSKQNTLALSR
ncbi:phage tail assembly chaperone [Pseudomonas extremaustralis]|uniref:Phage tail protein n=1 Tax=Pseudomonas extremaustralis TaxID=359110 RepID=A0A5C5Q1R5_9PSED|nr:phage tail assembly chaperone [Pseudomonas extremaustralis]TWR98376.1 hypothetical protein FIV36_29710 [Pseudomonas extremaustralis]SDE71043.1 hypothetical protein SAMN05216591_0697 [Pseudomonas extremaustralis]